MTASHNGPKENKVKRRRFATIMSALLIAQLAVAAIMLTSKLSDHHQEASLLTFDPKKVTKIVIEQNDNDSDGAGDETRKVSPSRRLLLIMTARADWSLPDYYGFPASSELIHQTLDTLAGLKKGYPLGTTDDAQRRRRVGTKNFCRSITLYEGQKEVGRIFIGTPLTVETSAVRSNDEQSVFSAELTDSQITANADQWIDRRAASINLKNIAAIDMGSFRLENLDEKWKLIDGERTDLLSVQAVQGLIYPVANCKISSVLGKTPAPEFNLEHPILSFKIRLKNKYERSYAVSKANGSGLYVLRISGWPWYLAADRRSIDKIRACTPETLRQQELVAVARSKRIDLKSMLKKSMQQTYESVDHF